MGNNGKIFTSVTNWKIETYGEGQKKSKFSLSYFRVFWAVISRGPVF